jgi:eukaryotic-like serine/threonine-protein kinase
VSQFPFKSHRFVTASSVEDPSEARLGHYQLRRKLGEGGFGEVYEAWDTELHRLVAIKRIRSVGEHQSLPNLVREARLAASLSHPAFVRIHALQDDHDGQSIVMELVQGVTARAWSRERTISESEALQVVLQVAEGMHEAHSAGLIHGDLKPSNLMLEPSGKVRILDFGVASRNDPHATATMTQQEPQGTIQYMAPERLLGQPVSAQSDVYALGVILYELAGGQPIFPTLSGLALAAAHMQSSSVQWPFPEGMSAGLVRLIRAMTERDTDHRLKSMVEVKARAAAQLGAPPLVPVPEPAPSVDVPTPKLRSGFVRWAMASRKTLLAGSAFLLLAGAGFGVWQSSASVVGLKSSLTPFSTSAAMARGLDALRLTELPGNIELAEREFNQVLQREPNHAAAVAGLSLVYSFRHLSDRQDEVWLQRADASAQQAMKLNEHLALSHVAAASVLRSQLKFADALAAYERALALEPANTLAKAGQILILRVMRRYADAESVAARAAAEFPKEMIFEVELGTIFWEQAKYAEAVTHYQRAVALQPDVPSSYASLASAYVFQGKNAEALRILQQGLHVRPSAQLYGNLGNILFNKGDYLGAAAAFEDAVSPDKGNPNGYLQWANLADTLLWIPGRENDARKAYQKAIELLKPRLRNAPNELTNLSRLALYSARVNDRAGAEELFRHPALASASNAAVAFRLGVAQELLGNRQVALEQIGKAQSMGYPMGLIQAEPALVALRRDPAFKSN